MCLACYFFIDSAESNQISRKIVAFLTHKTWAVVQPDAIAVVFLFEAADLYRTGQGLVPRKGKLGANHQLRSRPWRLSF